MATGTYTASELKYCRNGTSWRTDGGGASVGQSFTYDSISRIGYLGFNFNLAGKYITNISFTFSYGEVGLGDWKTKSIDFYRYVSSSSPTATVGSYIGGFSGTGMYNCTSTYTFNSTTNAAAFTGLKAYFEEGGSTLIIKAPSTDSKTHSYGEYTDSYLLITSASVTIDYVDKYKISYNVNGGGGSIADTWLPSGVAGQTTSATPSKKPDYTANANTVYYNANGGTASKSSDTNTVTYTYQFNGWNTAANGSGTSYGSNASITITGNLTLYAQWSIASESYSSVTSATASKANTTSTRTVTLNYNGGSTLTSTATTSYSCTGWYTATVGGTKRVNTNTAFKPNAETLYAQYSSSTTNFSAVNLPTPTKDGATFIGWVDGNGTLISTGGSYVPSANITLSPSWQTYTFTVTIKDLLNNEVKFSNSSVEYDTVFTLPSYASKRTELNTNEVTTLTFADYTYSGFTTTEEAEQVQAYIFNNLYAKYEDGVFVGYYAANDTTTIVANTEFSMVFEPEADPFIKVTTPPAPEAPFGKRFQGWASTDSELMYNAGTTYVIYAPDDSYTFDGVWINSLDNYGKNLYFKVGGEMKQGTAYVKAGGEYKEAVAVFIKVNGRWKTKEG